MIEEEGPLFPRDHNQRPGLLSREMAIADLREWLTEHEQRGGKTFEARRQEFLRAAGNAVIRSRESAGAAADIVKLAVAVRKEIEAGRLARSNPYRDIADALGRTAVEFWYDVDVAMQELRQRIDRWTAEEDARIEEQRQEQAREEARLRAAAQVQSDRSASPQPADPPAPARRRPIRGDYGAVVATGERLVFEIADVALVPDWVLKSPIVGEAILTVARRVFRDMGAIPGIRVSTVPETTIR